MQKECPTHGKNCDGGCTDPDADNGMVTKIWGGPGWLFLHSVAYGYPYAINPNNEEHNNKKRDYKNFFESIGDILPCRYCRDSYKVFIKEIPIDNYLDTRAKLCEWLYNLHNKVNDKLGVPKCDIPKFEEVNTLYETFRAKCKKTTNKERDDKLAKGCITPATGTHKKCVMKIDLII